MKSIQFALLWSALAISCCLRTGAQEPASTHFDVIFERNQAVTMRDGTILRADVYRPKADGKFPVLITRTPYDKQDERELCAVAAERGYIAIAQDVRGRYKSDGEWYPFKHESADGYDTVEWAAALPYSDGKVGMFGSSYVGATQLLAAIAHPPHLAGIFPGETASNYHDGWAYQGGAFEQWMNESWTSRLAFETVHRRFEKETDAMKWADNLPLDSFPVQIPPPQQDLAPYFFDWLAHPSYDDYWKQWSIEDHLDQINVPVYHVGDWYDIFLRGTLRDYTGLLTRGGSDAARKGQRILIGVGGHSGGGPKIGELDFGPQLKVEEDELILSWYDSLFKGIPNGVEQQKPVKIFVMGKNFWREENEWPLARAKNTRYFLQSGNGLAGAPSTGKDEFTYDPANPVPTHGGPLCCDKDHLAPGPRDQREVESRKDVLVYNTPAFEKDFEVTGPVSLELFVSSSAVDTDFTGKLVDVWPNGYAQNLTEGILRMRYRSSQDKLELMKPGTVYPITIDLVATSNVFLSGHKLRLEVSSSNFPRFDRNLNTGEEQAHATRMVKASNVVWHDKEHPSAIILPVVPE